jgi:hypothetical protein
LFHHRSQLTEEANAVPELPFPVIPLADRNPASDIPADLFDTCCHDPPFPMEKGNRLILRSLIFPPMESGGKRSLQLSGSGFYHSSRPHAKGNIKICREYFIPFTESTGKNDLLCIDRFYIFLHPLRKESSTMRRETTNGCIIAK